MKRVFGSGNIAFAVEREAGTNKFSSLTAQEKLKKVLDNRNGVIYDIRVAAEKRQHGQPARQASEIPIQSNI